EVTDDLIEVHVLRSCHRSPSVCRDRRPRRTVYKPTRRGASLPKLSKLHAGPEPSDDLWAYSCGSWLRVRGAPEGRESHPEGRESHSGLLPGSPFYPAPLILAPPRPVWSSGQGHPVSHTYRWTHDGGRANARSSLQSIPSRVGGDKRAVRSRCM